MHTRKGFTLVEILVVIAVVVVIAAILLPALIGAKRRARSTDDLSKFRQLGVAANLYHEDSGVWPRGVSDLVSKGLAPKELCSFANDPTPLGLGNEVAVARDKVPVLPQAHLALSYRNSLIGLREDCVPEKEMETWIEAGQGGGWLLDLTESDRSELNKADAFFSLSNGKYRRLCFDGAVVTRTFRSYPMIDEGREEQGRSVISFFVDPSSEMIEWLKRS